MWSMAKIRSKEYGQRWLSDATLPEATTDCCVANTIVNCYYWNSKWLMLLPKAGSEKKTKKMWSKDMRLNQVKQGYGQRLVNGKDVIDGKDGVDGNDG